MRDRFPARAWIEIEEDMIRGRGSDTAWTSPKNFAASYFAGQDVADVAREAFVQHIGDNVTHRYGLHPSVVRYETDAIAFVSAMLNAPDDARGTVTTGGSESLFLAMRAAREQARADKPHITEPEVLLTHTTYPVFHKAAHALGLRVAQVDSTVGYRADVAAVEAAITPNTIMLVGGAPPFPFGLVDPMPDLSALAVEHDLWLHADACIGGFVLPFAEALGRPMPVFDFRLPGVRSMSIDFHKYGYAMRGCSAVLLRDEALHEFQVFSNSAWPAGHYASDTMAGSRNAGPVASAWAVINYLGYDGYLDVVGRIVGSMDRVRAGIEAIDDLYVHGEAEGAHFSFGSDVLDMIAVGDGLMEHGWMLNIQTDPESLLLMLSAQHTADVIDEFLNDLAHVAGEVRAGTRTRADNDAAYGIY